MKKVIYKIKLWISPVLLEDQRKYMTIQYKYDELIKLSLIGGILIGVSVGSIVATIVTYMIIK